MGVPQPTLVIARLTLRPFCDDDAPRVQLLAGDSRVAATTANILHPYPDGAAEAWMGSHALAWNQGSLATSAITPNDEGLLIGAISLMGMDGRSAELTAKQNVEQGTKQGMGPSVRLKKRTREQRSE